MANYAVFLGKMIDFPEGILRLHDRWRDKLGVAQARYAAERTEASRMEYLRVLRTFTALVIRNELPDESADG